MKSAVKEVQTNPTEKPGLVRLGYSFAEAVEVTSLSRRTLEYEIAEGRLEAVKVGRRTVIKARSLERLLGLRRQQKSPVDKTEPSSENQNGNGTTSQL